ncbi:MAG: heat-shock protein [Bacteroidetes bacterium HGW-Bacteroidetes-10]|jgi:HSP20 family protein|nr:MAG: heat-shock protein [Bacteroidetes bacterium HGW-Bacteroidetes-10]
MTLIRRTENYPAWSNLFNEFLNHDWIDWTHRNYSDTNTTIPSVNILENQDGFKIEVAAPGLNKNDFKIEVNQGTLKISSEKQEERESEEEGKYSRKEFSYQSFSRSFNLPVTVESDKIEAKYENGILTVSIPKRDEAKPKPVRMIEIQ